MVLRLSAVKTDCEQKSCGLKLVCAVADLFTIHRPQALSQASIYFSPNLAHQGGRDVLPVG